MNTTEISVSRLGVTILRPILIGGSLAGTFDLVIALLIAGRDAPLEIKGGHDTPKIFVHPHRLNAPPP